MGLLVNKVYTQLPKMVLALPTDRGAFGTGQRPVPIRK